MGATPASCRVEDRRGPAPGGSPAVPARARGARAWGPPRPGRAVSRGAAGPYKEKLLELPAFLSTGGLPSDNDQLLEGLDLTGYFLERHVFWSHNKPLPPARSRFMETLKR